MKCIIEATDIPLEKPFKYFLAELKTLPYSKVVITTGDGYRGEGEAAHSIDVNGELQEGAENYAAYITHAIESFDTISSVEEIAGVMENARLYVAHNTGILCGVEQALFSILSQKTGKTIASLLGAKSDARVRIQTTVPYLATITEYQAHLDSLFANNHPEYVKFKVGKNLELEVSAVQYAKSINANVSISVDANQAFSDAEAAADFANKLDTLSVAWAEQLLHKDDVEGLRILRSKTKLPLMIDEALHTPLDAEYYAKEKLTDYFNIKLAKTGGILKALEIIEIGKKYDIPVMLGSMLHGKLGIQYNLAFALSQDFVTQDFYSYFSVTETKDLGYISNNLEVTTDSLYGGA